MKHVYAITIGATAALLFAAGCGKDSKTSEPLDADEPSKSALEQPSELDRPPAPGRVPDDLRPPR